MKTFVLYVALTTLVMLVTAADNLPTRADDKEIIQAFLKSHEINQAQDEFKGWADPGEASILLSNGQCGVAGCGYSALVAQKYKSRGSNTSTTHILALVHVSPNGEIGSVERVKLVPFKNMDDKEDTPRKD